MPLRRRPQQKRHFLVLTLPPRHRKHARARFPAVRVGPRDISILHRNRTRFDLVRPRMPRVRVQVGRVRRRDVHGLELASCKDTRKQPRGFARPAAALQSSRSRTPRSALPFVLETARCKFLAAASRRAGAHEPASHLAPRAQLAATRRRGPNERHQTPAAAPAASAREPRVPPVKHERLRGVRLR